MLAEQQKQDMINKLMVLNTLRQSPVGRVGPQKEPDIKVIEHIVAQRRHMIVGTPLEQEEKLSSALGIMYEFQEAFKKTEDYRFLAYLNSIKDMVQHEYNALAWAPREENQRLEELRPIENAVATARKAEKRKQAKPLTGHLSGRGKGNVTMASMVRGDVFEKGDKEYVVLSYELEDYGNNWIPNYYEVIRAREVIDGKLASRTSLLKKRLPERKLSSEVFVSDHFVFD